MDEKPMLTRRQRWSMLAALGVAATLLNFSYKTLDRIAWGMPARAGLTLMEQFTGAFTAVALLPFIVWTTRRYAPAWRRWWRWLPVHAAAFVAFSILHTSLIWGSRLLLSPLLGLGAYRYANDVPARYLMEAGSDGSLYVVVLLFTVLFDRYRAAQRKELELARLETRLAEARLHALQAQIHPHFLFNALNTISSVMYDDVVAADAMIAGLGELLRRTMGAGKGEVSLSEELRLLELYLDIMRARFEGTLDVRLEVQDAARDAAVPPLLLQPLVENALRHGMPAPPEPARIVVSAERVLDQLRLEVRDNGPGVPDPGNLPANGMGLANTAERLAQLHGDRARMQVANGKGGGLCVTLVLPYRPALLEVPAAGRAGVSAAPGEAVPWSR